MGHSPWGHKESELTEHTCKVQDSPKRQMTVSAHQRGCLSRERAISWLMVA